MVPSGHLAASITHSQTAEEILKHAFLGSNLLSQSHKCFIPGDQFFVLASSSLPFLLLFISGLVTIEIAISG